MNVIATTFLIVLLSLTVLPLAVYFCVKFGTYAFFKAKELSKQKRR